MSAKELNITHDEIDETVADLKSAWDAANNKADRALMLLLAVMLVLSGSAAAFVFHFAVNRGAQ